TDLPAWLYSNVWDMSSVISDSSILGNLFASMFAYPSQPIGWDLAVLGAYWVTLIAILKWQMKAKVTPTVQATAEQA
ncbi:hypothetical protein, partial [Psychromonas aquatilis]